MTTTTVFGRLPNNSIKANLISAEKGDTVLGVLFPLYDATSNAKGIFNKTDSFELLKSELRQFIRTERGERVMLPNFGLSLHKYLFEQMNPDMLENLQEEIIQGIAAYLPSARIAEIRILEGDSISGLGLAGIKIKLLITEVGSTNKGILELNL